MNKLAFDAPCDRTAINMSADTVAASGSRLTLLQVISVTIALLATAVSFGIAAYSNWSRGGTQLQRTMMMALAGAAVLYVHLIPMGGMPSPPRSASPVARCGALASWP